MPVDVFSHAGDEDASGLPRYLSMNGGFAVDEWSVWSLRQEFETRLSSMITRLTGQSGTHVSFNVSAEEAATAIRKNPNVFSIFSIEYRCMCILSAIRMRIRLPIILSPWCRALHR